MSGEKKRYVVSLMAKSGTLEERLRDSTVVIADDIEEADANANEWLKTQAKGRDATHEGDVLQIVENGRVVRTVPLKVRS